MLSIDICIILIVLFLTLFDIVNISSSLYTPNGILKNPFKYVSAFADDSLDEFKSLILFKAFDLFLSEVLIINNFSSKHNS